MHGLEIEYVKEAYETNWMSTVGKNINEVERMACEYIGCKYAAALSAGTASLHLAMKLAGIEAYGMPKVGHGAILVEDVAESMGATYKGVQTGMFGKYNTISFNGNKIITDSAGGYFLTDDEEAANKVRKWSTQARENAAWYQHEELGYNYRMSNVQAGSW